MNNSDIAIGCTQEGLKFVGAITGNLYLNIPILYPVVYFHSSINRQFWICVWDMWVPDCVCVCVCVCVCSNLTPPYKNQIHSTIGNALILQRISNNMTWCTVTEVGSGRMNTHAFPHFLPDTSTLCAALSPTNCHLYSASHSSLSPAFYHCYWNT